MVVVSCCKKTADLTRGKLASRRMDHYMDHSGQRGKVSTRQMDHYLDHADWTILWTTEIGPVFGPPRMDHYLDHQEYKEWSIILTTTNFLTDFSSKFINTPGTKKRKFGDYQLAMKMTEILQVSLSGGTYRTK